MGREGGRVLCHMLIECTCYHMQTLPTDSVIKYFVYKLQTMKAARSASRHTRSLHAHLTLQFSTLQLLLIPQMASRQKGYLVGRAFRQKKTNLQFNLQATRGPTSPASWNLIEPDLKPPTQCIANQDTWREQLMIQSRLHLPYPKREACP